MPRLRLQLHHPEMAVGLIPGQFVEFITAFEGGLVVTTAGKGFDFQVAGCGVRVHWYRHVAVEVHVAGIDLVVDDEGGAWVSWPAPTRLPSQLYQPPSWSGDSE
jgi:hypothetical protein